MISEVLQSNQINTNADASIKGIGLQKVRAAERLLKAVLQEKKALYCMIEHVDDVLEGNWQGEVVKYTAEQNKSYSVDFSMNSHEIKNSLRIFFDTWLGTVEMSESIQFVFYTNVKFKKENKAGVFTPAFADPTVMIVNTELANGMKIDGFEDLLNPALKGKIAFGDPVNSSSAFQSLMAMLYGMGKNGDPMSPEAWDYVDKFIANLGGKMCNSSSQVYKGVAGGEYVVGLTWEDPAANLVKNGAKVKVVFPVEGAIFPGESVQILKNCKHPENAKKFVDYMLSEKVQNAVGMNLTVRPLRKGATLADYMTPNDKIKLAPNYDEKWVSENKAKITKMFSEHMEKSM